VRGSRRETIADQVSAPGTRVLRDRRRHDLAETIGLVALIWCAFCLRVYHLAGQSLWPDEAYSYAVSHWTLADVWASLRIDNVPLYTILLGVWQIAAGSSEFALRYPSVIASTPAVLLVYRLGRHLLDTWSGFVAAALLAVSPYQLYYAQEARTYSLLGTLGLLSSWLFLRWASAPPRRVLAAQGLLYGALLYTHFAALFILATHAVVALWSIGIRSWRSNGLAEGQSRPGEDQPGDVSPRPAADGSVKQSGQLVISGRWLWAWCAAVALLLPWLVPHFTPLLQVATGQTSHVVPRLISLGTGTLIDLTFGNHNGLDAGNPVDAVVLRHLALASLLLPLCWATALVPLRRGRRLTVRWEHVIAALHVLVPYVLLIGMVQLARDFATRYAFPATVWVPIFTVAGLRLLPLPLRWAGTLALAGFMLWGSLLYFAHPGFERLDFRRAVEYVADHRQSGDAVIVSPDVALTYDYYARLRGLHLPRAPLPETVPMVEGATLSTLASLHSHGERLWRIRWQDYYNDPRDVITAWLATHAIRVYTRQLRGGLSLELWLTRPPIVTTLPGDVVQTDQAVGQSVHLLGYHASEDWSGRLRVTFYWQLSRPLPDDYTVFLHLVDASGRHLAQGDSRPYDGQFPTTRWPVGPIIRDVHEFAVPPAVPAGRYRLTAGFYTLATMERLGRSGDDAVNVVVDVTDRQPVDLLGRLLHLLPAALRLDDTQAH
jgi:hypothetical protein